MDDKQQKRIADAVDTMVWSLCPEDREELFRKTGTGGIDFLVACTMEDLKNEGKR